MPKVGSKRFPYTSAGEKAAKSYAKATGKKMTVAKPAKAARGTKRKMTY